jgi:hypothetical protein
MRWEPFETVQLRGRDDDTRLAVPATERDGAGRCSRADGVRSWRRLLGAALHALTRSRRFERLLADPRCVPVASDGGDQPSGLAGVRLQRLHLPCENLVIEVQHPRPIVR